MSNIFTVNRWRTNGSSTNDAAAEQTADVQAPQPYAQQFVPGLTEPLTPLDATSLTSTSTTQTSANPSVAAPLQPTAANPFVAAPLAAVTTTATTTPGPVNASNTGGPHAIGAGSGHVEILVQFKPGTPGANASEAINGVGGTFVDTVRAQDDGKGDLISISVSEQRADAAIAALSHNPNVSFAEYNWAVATQLTSNDSYYTGGSMWGMYGTPDNTNFGSQAAEDWAKGFTGSQKVVIGDIDTGIDYKHKDLYLNVWLNQNEIPVSLRNLLKDTNSDGLINFVDLNDIRNSKFVTDINKNGYIDAGDLLNDARWENGVDEDVNGYKDDLIGWDFVNNDNDPYDDNNHGTHTAGTIGALSNGTGVIGVAPNVQIMPLKFLSASGSGAISNAILAEDYYTAAARSGQAGSFIATSNSWGGGSFSQAMLDSIIKAAVNDILFVAAAGNGGTDGVGDNNDLTSNYPSNYSTTDSKATDGTIANYEAVIAVAALTSSGTLASFSNYGATSVDLAAPGQGIWSTVAGGGYASYSGTSMATPHVSGALALLAAAFPDANGAQLRDALLSSVIPDSNLNLNGSKPVAKQGTLDASAALTKLADALSQKIISLSIDSNLVTEGDSGPQAITFTVMLTSSSAPASDVTVNWSLQNITTDSSDFSSNNSGLITFSKNISATPQTVTVYVTGDTVAEANEQFTLSLTTSTSGYVIANNTAIVTIGNNDLDDYVYAGNTTATLALGSPILGRVDYSTDLDAFKVSLSAGKTYCFDLTPVSGSSLDPQLTLLDSTFTKNLAFNDDITLGTLDSRIIYTTASNAGGTYYLAAGASAGTTGDYAMKATPALIGTDKANSISGTSAVETIIGQKGGDTMTGGGGADIFVFAPGDSGQTTGFDVITDFAKSQDIIDYRVALRIGGSSTATSNQTTIDQTNGTASFASGSGGTLANALSDIATSFTAAGDAAGEFALFQVNKTGSHYLFISDGVAGVTANDVLVQLIGINSINSIALSNGNLTIA